MHSVKLASNFSVLDNDSRALIAKQIFVFWVPSFRQDSTASVASTAETNMGSGLAKLQTRL